MLKLLFFYCFLHITKICKVMGINGNRRESEKNGNNFIKSIFFTIVSYCALTYNKSMLSK